MMGCASLHPSLRSLGVSLLLLRVAGRVWYGVLRTGRQVQLRPGFDARFRCGTILPTSESMRIPLRQNGVGIGCSRDGQAESSRRRFSRHERMPECGPQPMARCGEFDLRKCGNARLSYRERANAQLGSRHDESRASVYVCLNYCGV